MFNELKEIIPKELKDIMEIMSHKIENINKEINFLILELKNN